MPYHVVKVSGGYKVAKSDGSKMSNGRKYASNKPLTKKKAEAQMRAIYASEAGYVLDKKSPKRTKSSPKRTKSSPKRTKSSPKRTRKIKSPRVMSIHHPPCKIKK